VMSWIRSDDTMPLRDQRPTHTMFYDRATTPLTDKAKRTADKLFAIVEHFVSGDSLFDSWCIADSDLAFMIHRLLRNGDNVPDRVRVYAEHQWKRASVHEFVTRERVPYVAY
jgi:glutathione S-transferase